MVAKAPEELHGFEYDWLATDGAGYVALMCTAGSGYAPPAFLADTEAYERALDELDALPATTAATMAPEIHADCVNVWRDAAERGLFAFEADYPCGPYRLVAVPAKPARLEELPPAVREVAARVRLHSLSFVSATEISAAELGAPTRASR